MVQRAEFGQDFLFQTLSQMFGGMYGILTTKVGIHLKVLTFISLHFPTLVETCLSLGTFSQPISLFML